MLPGAFLRQDLISEFSNMRGSVLSLEGKDKEEFLISCRRCSSGCLRKESQPKNYLKIPGCVRIQCERRGWFAGLDRFWDLNLICESEDSFLHGLRTVVSRLVWEGNVRHSVINFLSFGHSHRNVRPEPTPNARLRKERQRAHTQKTSSPWQRAASHLGFSLRMSAPNDQLKQAS